MTNTKVSKKKVARKSKATGKTVAILCPGPSLPETWSDDTDKSAFDAVIGVNRAVLHDTCTHWAFIDPGLYIDHRPNYKPAIMYSKLAERKIDQKGLHDELFRHPSRVTTEDMGTQCPRSLSWTLYTMVSAIVYAETLGAKTIQVFGSDHAGTTDFDGYTGKNDNRTQARWETESKITRDVIGWLEGRGVTVKFVRGAE